MAAPAVYGTCPTEFPPRAGTLTARVPIGTDAVLALSLVLMVTALVGGKLYVTLEHIHAVVAKPSSILALLHVSGGFLGGFVGALLSLLIFCRRRMLSAWQVADWLTPSLALGLAIAKVGCFLGGSAMGARPHYLGPLSSTTKWRAEALRPQALHCIRANCMKPPLRLSSF